MPHVLFVYDHADSPAAVPEETRQAVYREYQALAEIPDMVGHRLQPGAPGTPFVCNSQMRPEKLRAPCGMKRDRNAIAPPIVGSGGG